MKRLISVTDIGLPKQISLDFIAAKFAHIKLPKSTLNKASVRGSMPKIVRQPARLTESEKTEAWVAPATGWIFDCACSTVAQTRFRHTERLAKNPERTVKTYRGTVPGQPSPHKVRNGLVEPVLLHQPRHGALVGNTFQVRGSNTGPQAAHCFLNCPNGCGKRLVSLQADTHSL